MQVHRSLLPRELPDARSALPFYERSLAIFERHDPLTKSVNTISAINDVGCALEDLERFDEARKCYERAYECSLRWQGPRHTETGAMASNLALILRDSFPDEVLKAVPLLRVSLKVSEVMNGENADETAEDRKGVAGCLLDCIKVSRWLNSCPFRVGDAVQVLDDLPACRQLAKRHGGWDDDMDHLCGKKGKVAARLKIIL